MNDKELLKRCAAGCNKAQMEIYDRHYLAVYRSTSRLIKESSTAEEIAQDSFIKLFQTAEKIKDRIECILAWLRKIAINASIDHLRVRKLEFENIDNSLHKLHNPEREVDTTHWRVEQVKHAIENLPTGYRTILTLKLYEGLDFNEIATYLDITDSTVRSQYSRAKQKLIEQIER